MRPSVDSFVEVCVHQLIRFTFKQSIYPIRLIYPLTNPQYMSNFQAILLFGGKSEFWSISANKLLEESSTETTDKLRGKLIFHALGSSCLETSWQWGQISSHLGDSASNSITQALDPLPHHRDKILPIFMVSLR